MAYPFARQPGEAFIGLPCQQVPYDKVSLLILSRSSINSNQFLFL